MVFKTILYDEFWNKGKSQLEHPIHQWPSWIWTPYPTDFVQVNRIFKDGEVFYGASYKVMKEMCNVVVLKTNPPSIASVEYFLLHKDTKTCYAVYFALQVTGSSRSVTFDPS
jgi:hypothetical protein